MIKREMINLTTLLILLIVTQVYSQISGISANKLTVQSASVVGKGAIEFEPAFTVMNSKSYFDESGNLLKHNGINTFSSMDFRITAGITDNLEFGTSIPSTIEEVVFGAKYLVYEDTKFSFALSSGVELPAGNKFVADSLAFFENIFTAAIGPVFTYNFSESSSLDFTFVFTSALGSKDFSDVLYGGIGWGYLIRDNLQFVAELAGYACLDKKICSGKLSLFPGITYDITENFSFALGFQHDLLGKNEENNFGYFGAFTISFN